MAYFKVETGGCLEKKGLLQVRFSMFLDESDKNFKTHYVYVAVMPDSGYPGEHDKNGSPVDIKEFEKWIDNLPHVWQVNPFHNHFIHVEPTIKDNEIMEIGEKFLKEAYIKWNAGNEIRLFNDRPRFLIKTSLSRKKEISDRITQLKISASEGKLEYHPSKDSLRKWSKEKPKTTGRLMGTIDIGAGTGTRTNYAGAAYSRLDYTNPANDTGIIDTWKIWIYTGTATDCHMGCCTRSGSTVTVRDLDSFGPVNAGSEQTFTGCHCDVVTGDLICQWSTPGTAYIYFGYTAPANTWGKSEELAVGASASWTDAGYKQLFAWYGTGTTETGGWVNYSKVLGVASANISKIDGIAIASLSKIDGLAK